MEIRKDLMTPKERMDAFGKGQAIDRIPCGPSMGVTLSSFIGRSTYEYYHSAQCMADLEIALFKKLRHDGVGISISLREIAEAMGTKVVYPQNQVSYVEEPAIKSILDIGKLSPVDIDKDGKISIRLEALKLVQDALGKEVDVDFSIPGPFTTASEVLGTENFLRALAKNPGKVHELLEIVTESSLRIIDRIAEMGVGFGMADPVASSSLISAKVFREFAMPYIKKCVDRMKEKSGRNSSLHVCGKSKAIWESLIETGITSLSLDNVEDLTEAKKAIGNKVCLIGNVPPVDIVRYGSYEEVVTASKLCIKKAYDSPKGFILSTGCQIPIGSPIENIQALMDTARSYGVYPIRAELL